MMGMGSVVKSELDGSVLREERRPCVVVGAASVVWTFVLTGAVAVVHARSALACVHLPPTHHVHCPVSCHASGRYSLLLIPLL